MTNLFDNTILCKDCNKKMQQVIIIKNGFKIRELRCPSCSNKITHPEDLKEYETFLNLKQKQYQVKLRFVGNSYIVSIPREIVNFLNEQEKELNNLVNLCLEDIGRISLRF